MMPFSAEAEEDKRRKVSDPPLRATPSVRAHRARPCGPSARTQTRTRR